jgi:hypothetical protein
MCKTAAAFSQYMKRPAVADIMVIHSRDFIAVGSERDLNTMTSMNTHQAIPN